MMFRSVFAKTLYDQRRLMLIWGLGVFGMVLMYAAVYPSFADNQDLVQVMKGLPKAVQDMIGGADVYATAHGYIGAEWFAITYPLLVGILGIVLGGGLLMREEESRTLELLLARPVSRALILRQKTAAMLAAIAAVGMSSWLAIAAGTMLIDKFSLNLGYVLEATVAGILLGWCFGLLTLAVTGIAGSRGLAVGIASLVFAASYMLSTFAQRVDWLAPVRNLSLFEQYSPTDTLSNGWKFADVTVLLAVCVACYVVADVGFRRRDTGR